jgi:hypothetical protein
MNQADPSRPPRSPLRVAVLTFGAVVLIGTIASFAILSANGWMNGSPEGRGEQVGRGLGVIGVVCAAVAYVIQRKRTARPR